MALQLLESVRVLDFSHAYAGPYCTRLLGDLGAEVIKIEPPGGDFARGFPEVIAEGESGFFVQQNCGKKSVCLDLRHPEAVRIALDLAARSDVVVENFRPGVLARLGLGYDGLRQHNAGVILCSISCYGQTGPYAEQTGGDLMAQAIAGAMWLNGERDGSPLPTGIAFGDSVTAVHAFGAICAALFARERTGEGQWIDCAIADCVFAAHDFAVERHLFSGGRHRPTRSGARHPSLAPAGVFAARDGYVTLVVGDDTRWARLCRAMERPALASDPRFATNAARLAHRAEVDSLVEGWIMSLPTRAAVVEALVAARVPAAPVLRIDEAIADPHLHARGMVVEVAHPRLGPVRIVNTPLKFSAARAGSRGQPPRLGEHGAEVLSDVLGLTAERIAELRACGALLGGQGV